MAHTPVHQNGRTRNMTRIRFVAVMAATSPTRFVEQCIRLWNSVGISSGEAFVSVHGVLYRVLCSTPCVTWRCGGAQSACNSAS